MGLSIYTLPYSILTIYAPAFRLERQAEVKLPICSFLGVDHIVLWNITRTTSNTIHPTSSSKINLLNHFYKC